jgi:hypothetical protein
MNLAFLIVLLEALVSSISVVAFTAIDLQRAIESKSKPSFNISSVYFSHIMKCGGSTFDNVLRRYGITHHVRTETTEAITADSTVVFKDPQRWSIVFVREPVERVFSHYKQVFAFCSSSIYFRFCFNKIPFCSVICVMCFQVKPWGNHTAGSASALCKTAAKESYASFVRDCVFAKNYMSRYLRGRIIHSLTNYTLIVPFEYYDRGMILLHMFANFSVEDILYIVQKNYSHSAALAIKRPTSSEIAHTEAQNVLDKRLYGKALRIWNQTIASLSNIDLQLDNYKKLLSELNDLWRRYDNKVRTHIPVYDQLTFIREFCQNSSQCRHNNLLQT